MKLNNTYYIALLVGIIVLSLSQNLNKKVREGLDDLPCELYTSLKTIEDILNGTTKLKTLDQTVKCLYPGESVDSDYKSDVASKSYSFNDIIQNIFLSGKILMTNDSSANTDSLKIYMDTPILPILAAFVDKINAALDVIYKEPKNADAISFLTQILNNNIFYFKDNNISYCSNLRQSINYSMVIIKAIFSTGIVNQKDHAAFLCFYTLQKDRNTFLSKKIRQVNRKLKDIVYNAASLDCTNSEPPFITNLMSYATGSEKTDFLNSGKAISLDKQYSGGNVMSGVKFKECPVSTGAPALTQKAVVSVATTQRAAIATTQKAAIATTQKAAIATTQRPSTTTTQKTVQPAAKK
jgi:hypothetical protein